VINVTVYWSCYILALCSNGRKYRHNFFCTRQPNVSPWSRSKLAYIDQSLPPQILPQSYPSHCWIKHRRHLMVNCGLDTTIVTIQWTAYRKLTLLFQMVPSLIPYDLPFSKMWVANAPHGQLRNACCHLANMMEDTDKLCSMQNVIMSQAMPPFAKLLWPLFKVFTVWSVTFCETRNWYLHGEHNF